MNQSNRAHPLMQRAWECYRDGDRGGASNFSQQVLDESPTVMDAWLLIALCRLDDGDVVGAEEALDELESEITLRVPVTLLRGRCALVDGRAEEAKIHFSVAREYQPDNADAQYGLAQALLSLGEKDAARTALRETISLRPEHGPAYFELGNLSLEMGDVDGAFAALRNAARLLPDSAQVANNLALVYQMRDDLERAERQYRRAVKLQEDFAEAWFNLSFVARARGNEVDADEALSKALVLKPELTVHLAEKGK